MKDMVDTAANNGWWLAPGVIGRMMFHSREVQAGRRRFWGKDLPFELLIAIGMSMIGYSLSVYLGLAGTVAAGLIGAIAYLGPRFIDTAGASLFDWFKQRKG